MQLKWIEVIKCPYCGSDDWNVAGKGESPLIANKDILGNVPLSVITFYRQCCGCGFIYQSPRFSDESIDYFYSNGIYRDFVNASVEQQDKLELMRYERIAKILPKPKPGDKLLDVGCSHGYLLDLAEGYETLGVEPNAGYVTSTKPTVRSLDEVSGEWNVITCLHVLEHVVDPFAMAERMMDFLLPGGWLFIETPGDPDKDINPFRLPHIYHFPPWIIRRMFEPLQLKYYEPKPHYVHVFRKGANETT